MREIREVGGSLSTSIKSVLIGLAAKDGVKLVFEDIESDQQVVKIYDKDNERPPAQVHAWLKKKSKDTGTWDLQTRNGVWVYTWDETYLSDLPT